MEAVEWYLMSVGVRRASQKSESQLTYNWESVGYRTSRFTYIINGGSLVIMNCGSQGYHRTE